MVIDAKQVSACLEVCWSPALGTGRSPFTVERCFHLTVFTFYEAELQAISQLAIIKTLIIKILGFITKPPYRRAFRKDAG